MPKIEPSAALFCSGLCLTLLSIVLISGVLPGAFLDAWFGAPFNPPLSARAHFIDRFFIWDSNWYDQVAISGYRWSPTGHTEQNVAFFPLWPIILRSTYAVGGTGQTGRMLVIGVTTILACGSIFAMHALADRLLGRSASRWATAFYGLNPAANFMIQSYPTGLMNLLAILCLIEICNRRYWRAATLGGIATAAGPLTVFLGVAVLVAALADDRGIWSRDRDWPRRLRSLIRLSSMGVVSLGGILAFMLWLRSTFGDSMAFVAAQDAWIRPAGFSQRIWIFLKSELLLFNFEQAARLASRIAGLIRADKAVQAEEMFEKAVAYTGLGFALIGTWAAFVLRPRTIALYGWLLIAAYIWLIDSNQGGYATLRLIYPAVPSCLGLALLLHRRRLLAWSALVLGVLTLTLQQMLVFRGYWVV